MSVDGTTLKANANKNRGIRYDRAGELIEELDMEVRELLEQAKYEPKVKAREQRKGRDDEEAHGDDPPRMNVLVSAHAEARAKYRLRKQTVELVFGTIKKWMGFTQFQLRGHENVSGEWQLVTLAYNMKRLWRMQSAQNQGI